MVLRGAASPRSILESVIEVSPVAPETSSSVMLRSARQRTSISAISVVAWFRVRVFMYTCIRARAGLVKRKVMGVNYDMGPKQGRENKVPMSVRVSPDLKKYLRNAYLDDECRRELDSVSKFVERLLEYAWARYKVFGSLQGLEEDLKQGFFEDENVPVQTKINELTKRINSLSLMRDDLRSRSITKDLELLRNDQHQTKRSKSS